MSKSLHLKHSVVTTLALLFVLMLLISNVSWAQTPAPEANTVIGQPDFNSNTPGIGAQSLNFPLGITGDNAGGIYVADRNNHRVLFFATGDAVADRVYGQSDNFNTYIVNFDGIGGSGAPSANTLNMPTVVAVDRENGLYVADRDNHRILYFANDNDSIADRVYGQFGNFGTNPANNDGAGGSGIPSAENIGVFSLGLIVDNDGGLYVADSSNNRVLFFANDGDTVADRVYGQFGSLITGVVNNDGTGVTSSPSADNFNFPRGMTLDADGGLYICDRENHRVLFFANDGDTTADRVYGQFGSFTTNAANNTGDPSADSLFKPRAISADASGGVYIADTSNNRILYFANDGDTTADAVYGQSGSFTTNAVNNDGTGNEGTPNAGNLNLPQGVFIEQSGRLYISDTGNNRILVFGAEE
ncbi:MAG: NHL repeat-containing protein [Chitinophagaceae bacterium]|nr:NHL repeat-containing protein [Anaerolineae bacterium]